MLTDLAETFKRVGSFIDSTTSTTNGDDRRDLIILAAVDDVRRICGSLAGRSMGREAGMWPSQVRATRPFTNTTHTSLEQKLLRCGRIYPLGRKAKHPLQLVVNHPKVSGEHFSVEVGTHSTADVVGFIPTTRSMAE